MKLNLKHKRFIALGLWTIGVLFFVGVISIPDFTTRIEGLGNTSSNISNGGIVAESQGWVYYVNSHDNNFIYKTDGVKDIKLNEHASSYINVVENWVFYINDSDLGTVHRMQTNGSKNESLKFRANKMVVEDAWIYFINPDYDKLICRVKVNGEKLKPLSTSGATNLALSDNHIYYNDNNTGILFRTDKVGGSEELLAHGVILTMIIVENNLIYFDTIGEDGGIHVYQMDLHGNNLQSVLRGYGKIQQFIVNDEFLFFVPEDLDNHWQMNQMVSKMHLASGKVENLAYYDIYSWGLTKENLYIKSQNHLTITDFYGLEANYFAKINILEQIDALNIAEQLGSTVSRGTLPENNTHIFINHPHGYASGYVMSYNKSSHETKRLTHSPSAELKLKDDWLYYININDNNSLYRMKTDGSLEEKFIDKRVFNLQVDGDLLYFVSIELDYQQNPLYLYSKNLNTGELKKVFDENLNTNSYGFLINDGFLYFIKHSREADGGISRINLNGEPEIEFLVESFEPFIVNGSKIYYIDNLTRLSIYDIETGDNEVLQNEVSSLLNVVGDKIFYNVDRDLMGRYFKVMDVNTKEVVEIPNRTGGFIYQMSFSSEFMLFNSHSPMTMDTNIYYINYEGKILNNEMFKDE